MLQWTEKMHTGDREIDRQHQLLIDSINRLETLAHITNPDRVQAEFILNLVDFLENYTRSHFAHEESCMARLRCPVHAQNLAAHAEFLQFFARYRERFEADGCRPELVLELYERCSDWIQRHILQIDLQLRPCVAPKPTR